RKMLESRDQLVAQNKGYFHNNAPFEVKTSIDSLSTHSPMFPPLLAAAPGPWVSYHNIVGRDPNEGWRKYVVGDGDGVVPLTSARLDDMPNLRSQIIVPSDHSNVHRHPESILEVRRILFEQLAELQDFPNSYGQQIAQKKDKVPR